jgi:hypothetical protein
MSAVAHAFAALVALPLLRPLAAQDGPPVLPPVLPPPPAERPVEAEVLDVDGAPAVAGRLPASTTADARAAWTRLAAALEAGGPARAPIAGFDLALELRLRVQENRTNDFENARYAYRAPGWILADTGKGRRQVRGPRGDWLYDASVPTERALVRLDVGRENAEDRRQLDEALQVARLFTLLVDARNVRVLRWAAAERPDALLPPRAVEAARSLAWFELETPDIRPRPDDPRGARIVLGLAPDSGLPALAVADAASAPRRLSPSTSAIELAGWRTFDGRLLPRTILVHRPRLTEGGAPDGWRDAPAMDLAVKSGTLSAPPDEAEFLPPAR